MKIIQENKGCMHSLDINLSTSDLSDHFEVCVPNLRGQLIGDETRHIFVAVFQVALTGILAVGGIITNTINIVVFIKMGLRDAVNISLFGLAIGDLCSLMFSLWESICFNPLFQDAGAVVVFTEIEYITGCWPHVCFVRVTSYITAFITLERCLCITIPLKVKTIVTAARTKGVIILIFLVVSVTSVPEYYVSQLVWKFYPEKNRTLLGIHFIEDRERFESVTLVLNNVVLQCIAFITVVVCTVILIVQLNRKARWRKHTVKVEGAASGKDKRAIKMVSIISVIFIVSNLPSCMVFMAMACTPKLHPSGNNYNMFYVIWSIVYVMEAINSTVNIFIYVNMSSRYKVVFFKTFICRESTARNAEMSRSKREFTHHSEVFSQ